MSLGTVRKYASSCSIDPSVKRRAETVKAQFKEQHRAAQSGYFIALLEEP